MKRVDCVGMEGKFPTSEGLLMFWDTGKSITPVQLAEILALQYSVFSVTEEKRKEAIKKITILIIEIVQQVNVYPVGQAALAGDGRILVTEPYYDEKESCV